MSDSEAAYLENILASEMDFYDAVQNFCADGWRNTPEDAASISATVAPHREAIRVSRMTQTAEQRRRCSAALRPHMTRD